VSTGFTVTIFAVISPSKLSMAVAPASVYVVPASTVNVALPFRVITGATVSQFTSLKEAVTSIFVQFVEL